MQIVVIAGGVAGGLEVQKRVKWAQREQLKLCENVSEDMRKKKGKKMEKVAVDKVFYARLVKILKM